MNHERRNARRVPGDQREKPAQPPPAAAEEQGRFRPTPAELGAACAERILEDFRRALAGVDLTAPVQRRAKAGSE